MTEAVAGLAPVTSSFAARDGLDSVEYWWATINPKAAVFLIHGYGEHAGRYQHIADQLAASNYALYAFDLRGHGRAAGKRGFIKCFDDYLLDVEAALDRFNALRGDLPAFHMGHSLGGLVLATYLASHALKTRGLIFSSPFLKMAVEVSPIVQKLSGVIAALAPNLPMGAVETNGLSRIPEEVTKYENDPLVYHGKVVASTGANMLRAQNHAQQSVSRISDPILIFHGTADRLAAFAGGEWLNDHVASIDKTFYIYKDGYHELFNDNERARFYQELIEWLDAHIPD